MLTGDAIGVDEAHSMGMVSKIFPLDELSDKTLDFARRIATVPTMAALLVKEAVNQTTDTMGFTNALNACFTMHQLNHSHWATITNGKNWVAQEEHGVVSWRDAPPIERAEKDTTGTVPAKT
jgi:enoyl-CoA hydratase